MNWVLMLSMAMMVMAAAAPPASRPSTQPEVALRTEKITIAGEEFELEVAADPASREKGLMGRDQIEPDKGMLFVYPEAMLLNFWMKNCAIDIDIIFVNDEGRVTAVHAMKAEKPRRRDETESAYEARLKTYSSRRFAQFAIELKAGTVERLKIRQDQKIEMDVKTIIKEAK
jgi:uncharacterized protein